MFPLRDDQPTYTPAIVTTLLIVACVLVFVFELTLDDYSRNYFISRFGVIPGRFVPMTLVTSMFLHGGWSHIIGNMLFLWAFGKSLEDAMGHNKFLIFYFACGIIAGLTHIFFNPQSMMPTVGASGAIAGVMGAYLIKFPRARIHTLIFLIFVTTAEIPAAFILVYWFVTQIFSGAGSIGHSNVSDAGVAWFAHIGGFVTGMILVNVMGRANATFHVATSIGRLLTKTMIDVLAIAAHPDDVEQTCGGTLLKMADQGYLTGIVDLTAGDMGTRGTPEIRVEESLVASQILGSSLRENLHFPDARLENSMAGRMTLAHKIRTLQPRVVILPYWTGRHPDHYRTSEIGYEACFLAGLRKLDQYTEPHRPFKILYSSIYANVPPSFVVDITNQFERRMQSLFAYRSQYASQEDTALFPDQAEIHERLAAIARYYGNLIGVRYGEPFVVKETMRVDDIVSMPVRSL